MVDSPMIPTTMPETEGMSDPPRVESELVVRSMTLTKDVKPSLRLTLRELNPNWLR
jgi:hypothetical protein